MGPDAKRNTGIEKGDEFVVRKDPADTFISGYDTEESRASGVSAAGYNTLLQEKNNIYNYTLTPQQPVDEESFEFSTHFKSAFVFIIATLDKQLKPILTFAAFLKRDLKPRDKIRSAMSIKSFTNICSYTCP